ncbi:MotE family protein [Candidatus Syntrophocurvum alkaliphilum]|nr:hypothetical protein [Candidatus Syntrophocurvum alkaliphilum]
MIKKILISIMGIAIILLAVYLVFTFDIVERPNFVEDIPVLGGVANGETEETELQKLQRLYDETNMTLDEKENELQEQMQANIQLENQLNRQLQEQELLEDEISELNDELESLRQELSGQRATYRDMATYYSAMRTGDAAEIISELEDEDIIGILSEMERELAASILQNMDRDKAVTISEQMLITSP